MKRIVPAVALVFLFLVQPLAAQKESDKDAMFQLTRAEVYDAALAVVKEHYTLVAAVREEDVITYQTGYSLTSNGLQVTVNIEEPNDKGEVWMHLRPAKKQQLFAWGAGGRASKKFIGQVRDQLKKT